MCSLYLHGRYIQADPYGSIKPAPRGTDPKELIQKYEWIDKDNLCLRNCVFEEAILKINKIKNIYLINCRISGVIEFVGYKDPFKGHIYRDDQTILEKTEEIKKNATIHFFEELPSPKDKKNYNPKLSIIKSVKTTL